MNQELKKKMFQNNYTNFQDCFPNIMADQFLAVIANEDGGQLRSRLHFPPLIASLPPGLICILSFRLHCISLKFHENNF